MTVRYFYVKAGGTASSSTAYFTTPKVNSWATAFSSTAEYFNSIEDVYQLAADADGSTFSDYWNNVIVVSNTYNKVNVSGSYGFNRDYVFCGAVLSVNDNSIDQLSYGATRSTYDGYGSIGMYALWPCCHWLYGCKGILQTTTNNENNMYLGGEITENCYFDTNVSGTWSFAIYDLSTSTTHTSGMIHKDTTIDLSQFNDVRIANDVTGPWFNCTFMAGQGGSDLSYEVLCNNPTRGYYFVGCDFSNVDRPVYWDVYDDQYIQTTTKESPVIFEGCVFNSSYNYVPYQNLVVGGASLPVNNLILDHSPIYIHSSCTSSTASSFPRNYTAYTGGYSQHVNSTYRDNGAEWNIAGDNYSVLFSVNSVSSLDSPYFLYKRFYISSTWLDMSKQYTFTLYLKDTNNLKRDQIWFEVYYANQNSDLTSDILHGSTREYKITIGGGSSLETSTDTWNGSTTGSRKLTLTIGGDGSFSPVMFYLGIQAGNSVYACPKVEY
jgi:hypothetical protein